MSTGTISVERVSKRYDIHTGQASYGLLSRNVDQALRRLLRRPVSDEGGGKRDFWALRDVSLEVGQGQVLGLIGANGAGKSTLLKLLSRITLPTEGKITIWGRVGALLEVGTGFHQELSGRENVYLNGAILGMRRREIEARFDEIVAFAGVEQFLDTPVKHYSSGMHMRLAFAVAAHLEPEVLLVDEVLAVGDAQFQRKSLGKLDEVASEGRTVVLVSHNLAAVQRLCDRTVWLDRGEIREDGNTGDVLAAYQRHAASRVQDGEVVVPEDMQRIGTGEAKLRRVGIRDEQGDPVETINLGQPCSINMTFEVSRQIEDGVVEIGVSTADGNRAVTVLSSDQGESPLELDPGTHAVSAELDMVLLPGEYTLTVGMHGVSHTFDYVERVLGFSSLNVPHSGVAPYPWPETRGVVRVPSRWSVAEPGPAAGSRPPGSAGLAGEPARRA